MAYARRTCQVCNEPFSPPHRGSFLDSGDNFKTHCASCRSIVKAAEAGEAAPTDGPVLHAGAAPMTQIVFDLETWGLDRGWGVTLVASFLIHGGIEGPTKRTLTLRDYPSWKKGSRSDDREMVTEVLNVLRCGHIAYAHNGDRFDIRWLRTVALKYGLDMPRIKLVDPCAIAWKKYLLGRNSLEAVADFLNLEEKGKQKLHISPDVWRKALMDNDDSAWRMLVERCESDVDLLNEVASKVTGDVGLVDFQGSWR